MRPPSPSLSDRVCLDLDTIDAVSSVDFKAHRVTRLCSPLVRLIVCRARATVRGRRRRHAVGAGRAGVADVDVRQDLVRRPDGASDTLADLLWRLRSTITTGQIRSPPAISRSPGVGLLRPAGHGRRHRRLVSRPSSRPICACSASSSPGSSRARTETGMRRAIATTGRATVYRGAADRRVGRPRWGADLRCDYRSKIECTAGGCAASPVAGAYLLLPDAATLIAATERATSAASLPTIQVCDAATYSRSASEPRAAAPSRTSRRRAAPTSSRWR